MLNLSEKILMIVPCFNEEERLPVQAFKEAAQDKNLHLFFVNDGSTDQTEKIIKTHFQGPQFYYLALPENKGKAEAIRQAMMAATQLEQFSSYVWLGFWDADLATPLEEISRFLDYQKCYSLNVESIWGSRVKRLGADIQRKYYRHILGRIFATVAKIILNVNCYDSQCGAKLFRKDVIPSTFNKPFCSRWIFDLEIYLRLNKEKIIEYPLQTWKEQKGSKIKIVRESWRILLDLFKIYSQKNSPRLPL